MQQKWGKTRGNWIISAKSSKNLIDLSHFLYKIKIHTRLPKWKSQNPITFLEYFKIFRVLKKFEQKIE